MFQGTSLVRRNLLVSAHKSNGLLDVSECELHVHESKGRGNSVFSYPMNSSYEPSVVFGLMERALGLA